MGESNYRLRRVGSRLLAAAMLLSILIASPLHRACAQSPQRIALLIGNQGYASAVGPLSNPHRDIELLEKALSRVGFKVLSLVRDASREDILRAVYDYAEQLKRAGPDAVGFFYYSGHGVAETEFGPNYLIPIDLKHVTRSALRIKGVKLSEITDILDREAPNAAHIVVFDACRNELRGTRGSKGFVAVSEKTGMLIAFASAPGTTATDGTGKSGGPYAQALAHEITKQGQDHYSVLFNVREALASDPETGGQFPWWRDGLRKRIRFGETREEQVAVGITEPLAAPAQSTCDGVEVSLGTGGTQCLRPGSGNSFKDCADCPEMVVVPADSFMMGSAPSEIDALTKQYGDYFKDEEPQHVVTIPHPFAVGKFEVTFAGWDICVSDGGCKRKPEAQVCVTGGGCKRKPEDQGWGRGGRPVINVSWNDVTSEYLPWLRRKTGKGYRLLTESEWEYSARGGTQTPFWWGASISPTQANYDGNYTYGGGSKGEYRKKTVPVKIFDSNRWGLYQVHGNVWEWVQDCYAKSYTDAPTDGSAAKETSDCARVLRGGSWSSSPQDLRSASRFRDAPGGRISNSGFRVARTLTPTKASSNTDNFQPFTAITTRTASLREEPRQLASSLRKLETGVTLTITGEVEDEYWYSAKAKDGQSGYILKNDIRRLDK